MVHVEDVLLYALAQKGDRYIFGAEARATDPNPSAFDCSELVEWACSRAGVSPKMPDGAFNQREHCQRSGTGIPLGQGLRTRGALLFVGDGTGVGRDAITHVAWSLGDGTTIEARGSKWGVGTWPSTNRFDFAGLMPGVDYSPGHGQLEPQEDPFMALTDTEQQEVLTEVRNMSSLLSGPLGAAIGRLDVFRAQMDPDAFADRLASKLEAKVDGIDKDTVKAAVKDALREGTG